MVSFKVNKSQTILCTSKFIQNHVIRVLSRYSFQYFLFHMCSAQGVFFVITAYPYLCVVCRPSAVTKQSMTVV